MVMRVRWKVDLDIVPDVGFYDVPRGSSLLVASCICRYGALWFLFVVGVFFAHVSAALVEVAREQ